MPQWFPDPQCRTSDKQPIVPPGPTSWHYVGDRRRRIPTHCGDERSGSSFTADDTQKWWDGTWYFSSHVTHWLPRPWRMQQSLQPQVKSWNCPNPLVPKLVFRKTNGCEELTVPSGGANWSDRRLQNFRHYGLNWTTSCLLRSWQSSVS